MLDFWMFVLVTAGIYTILSLGLIVQLGVAGLPNFGIGAFMAVSAYTMAICIIHLHMPMPIAACLAIVASVFFGFILAIPTVRLRADYLAIATVAAGEIVRYLALNLQSLTGGAAGSINMKGPAQAANYNLEWTRFQSSVRDLFESIFGYRISPDTAMAIIVWVVALLLVAAVWYMVKSPWGRVLRSIREDEEATKSMGKSVFSYKLQAFSVGAALAGVAGLFFAWQVGTFSPNDFRTRITFYAFLIVILGGKTNVLAVPIAALVFAVVFAGTRFLEIWPISLVSSGDRAFVRQIIVGGALVALLIWRPQGLFGNRKEDSHEVE